MMDVLKEKRIRDTCLELENKWWNKINNESELSKYFNKKIIKEINDSVNLVLRMEKALKIREYIRKIYQNENIK